MAHYPNLDELLPQEEEFPSEEEESDSSDEEGDSTTSNFDDCYYDEYGALVHPGDEKEPPAVVETPKPASGPIAAPAVVPVHVPAVTPAAAAPAVPITKSARMQRRSFTLTRDQSGKLGIKLTRMGKHIYFSFVETGSSAAEQGIGFGDQLVGFQNVNLDCMTGGKLMQSICSSKLKSFNMTVVHRPYDFTISGKLKPQGEMEYSTTNGKVLGSVKVHSMCRKGYINHFKLLSVNGKQLVCAKESEITTTFKHLENPFELRVMPRALATHLMKRQEKERMRARLHLSSAPK